MISPIGMCDAFPSSGPHRTIEEASKMRVGIALLLIAGLAVGHGLCAQAAPPQQNKPAEPQKKQPPAEANPFPDDTTTVPLMPSGNAPAAADVPANAPSSSALTRA